jgi:hypothetical protein
VAVESFGTQTAVVSTEHTLVTEVTGKWRVLVVSLANLVAGDTVVLRAKAPVISGGPDLLIKEYPFTGVQAEPNVQSFGFDMPYGGTFTLTQTAGTARTYAWHVTAWVVPTG